MDSSGLHHIRHLLYTRLIHSHTLACIVTVRCYSTLSPSSNRNRWQASWVVHQRRHDLPDEIPWVSSPMVLSWYGKSIVRYSTRRQSQPQGSYYIHVLGNCSLVHSGTAGLLLQPDGKGNGAMLAMTCLGNLSYLSAS